MFIELWCKLYFVSFICFMYHRACTSLRLSACPDQLQQAAPESYLIASLPNQAGTFLLRKLFMHHMLHDPYAPISRFPDTI